MFWPVVHLTHQIVELLDICTSNTVITHCASWLDRVTTSELRKSYSCFEASGRSGLHLAKCFFARKIPGGHNQRSASLKPLFNTNGDQNITKEIETLGVLPASFGTSGKVIAIAVQNTSPPTSDSFPTFPLERRPLFLAFR